MATAVPPTLIVRRRELLVPLYRIHLGPLEERILWDLAAQHRRRFVAGRYEWRSGPLGIAELVAFCYGDDPDGGPDQPERVIQAKICTLNRTLGPLGWRIAGDGHRGYVLEPAGGS